jgi:hypothetical protein
MSPGVLVGRATDFLALFIKIKQGNFITIKAGDPFNTKKGVI